jgi:hypothetical protein
MPNRGTNVCGVIAAVVLLPAAVTTAPQSGADPTSTLTGAVQTLRTASNCPDVQWDPLVQRGAQMANQATADYINHRNAAVPFTDPMPALKTIGYAGSKGVLLSGYGATAADALHALVLQYQAGKPDCAYTAFGADGIRDDAGFDLTSVILTVPSQPAR